jgi:hypothetical protein
MMFLGSKGHRRKIFTPPYHLDQLWDPLNLLSSGFSGALYLGRKRQGRESDHSLPTSAEVRETWVYTSTSPKSSWHSAYWVKHRATLLLPRCQLVWNGSDSDSLQNCCQFIYHRGTLCTGAFRDVLGSLWCSYCPNVYLEIDFIEISLHLNIVNKYTYK